MTSTENTAHFARLNDTNYAEWAVRMEATLTRYSLWKVVDVTVDTAGKSEEAIAAEIQKRKAARKEDDMARARAEMILRVEDNQLVHMSSRDPMEIWQTIERVHRAAGFATSLSLRRRFLTAKKGSEQSMQAWIGSVQALAFRMDAAGISVTDQDKILAITMGLPPSYDNVIINFDSMSPDALTLDLVIARLLNEEVRQKTAAPIVKAEEEEDENVAMTATPGRSRTRSEVKCYFCDAIGHYKSDCPERKAWEKSQTKKKTTDTAAAAWESDDSSDGSGFEL